MTLGWHYKGIIICGTKVVWCLPNPPLHKVFFQQNLDIPIRCILTSFLLRPDLYYLLLSSVGSGLILQACCCSTRALLCAAPTPCHPHQGTFDSVWRHFQLFGWGDTTVLCVVNGGQGCYWTSYKCTVQSTTTRIIQPQLEQLWSKAVETGSSCRLGEDDKDSGWSSSPKQFRFDEPGIHVLPAPICSVLCHRIRKIVSWLNNLWSPSLTATGPMLARDQEIQSLSWFLPECPRWGGL